MGSRKDESLTNQDFRWKKIQLRIKTKIQILETGNQIQERHQHSNVQPFLNQVIDSSSIKH